METKSVPFSAHPLALSSLPAADPEYLLSGYHVASGVQ